MAKHEYDLVVRGGTVVDGTRVPKFRADVGLKDGRIAKIGRIDDPGSARVLDASGSIVAPGFVDVHTHYDAQIHWDPYCTISGWHGVTSVVLGNCGFGFAPCKPADKDRALIMMTRTEQIPYDSMIEGMPWQWETFPEWLDAVQKLPKGVNAVNFMPLSSLMIYVMGLEAAKSRPATPEEQKEMQRLLHDAMDAGACGFSFQRLGPNSLQADYDGTPMPTDIMVDEDILVLADVLRERDEGWIQVTQAGNGNPFAADEATRRKDFEFLEELAERAQRPVLHNLILALDEDPEFHVRDLAWVHECNKKGLRIYGQGSTLRTLFTFSMDLWNLYDASPAWNHVTTGSFEEKFAKMSDPELRGQLREEEPMLSSMGELSRPMHLTVIETPGHPELEKYIGQKVGDIAAAEGKHAVDVLLDLSIAGDLKVMFRTGAPTSIDPIKVGEIARDPYVIPGVSDGGAHTKFFTGGAYTTDFLTWLVRDTGELSLEEAHYRLSYMPAQMMGLTDRGSLREGAAADIVVYDLERLKRTPDWGFERVEDLPANEWRVIQRAEGYRFTIVNGEVTFEDGECTGATPGQLLRNGIRENVELTASPD